MSDIGRVKQLEAALDKVVDLFISYRAIAIEAVAEAERKRDEAREQLQALHRRRDVEIDSMKKCWKQAERERDALAAEVALLKENQAQEAGDERPA